MNTSKILIGIATLASACAFSAGALAQPPVFGPLGAERGTNFGPPGAERDANIGSFFSRGSTTRGFQQFGGFLNRLDANEDGVIDQEEFSGFPLFGSWHFSRLDTNEDGLVSLTEFTERTSRWGNISDEDSTELAECMRNAMGDDYEAIPSLEERFADIDNNADGFIDDAEIEDYSVSISAVRFESLDANSDGVLDADELDTHSEASALRREAFVACREGSSFMFMPRMF